METVISWISREKRSVALSPSASVAARRRRQRLRHRAALHPAMGRAGRRAEARRGLLPAHLVVRVVRNRREVPVHPVVRAASGEAETEAAVLAGAHRVRREGDAVAVPVARLHRVAEIELVPAAGVRGGIGGVARPAGVAPDPDVQAHVRREDRREPVRDVHPHGDRVVGPERRDLAVGLVRARVRRDRDRLDPRVGAHLQAEGQVGRAVEAVRRPQRVVLPRQRAAIRPRDRRRGRVQRIARRQRPRRRHRIADVVRRGRVRHPRQPVAHRRARVEENGRSRHPGEGRRRRVHLVAGLVGEAVQVR